MVTTAPHWLDMIDRHPPAIACKHPSLFPAPGVPAGNGVAVTTPNGPAYAVFLPGTGVVISNPYTPNTQPINPATGLQFPDLPPSGHFGRQDTATGTDPT